MEKTDDLSDDAILKTMLSLAERLCQRDDALMQPQYRHLRGRIDALIALRNVASANAGETRG